MHEAVDLLTVALELTLNRVAIKTGTIAECSRAPGPWRPVIQQIKVSVCLLLTNEDSVAAERLAQSLGVVRVCARRHVRQRHKPCDGTSCTLSRHRSGVLPQPGNVFRQPTSVTGTRSPARSREGMPKVASGTRGLVRSDTPLPDRKREWLSRLRTEPLCDSGPAHRPDRG